MTGKIMNGKITTVIVAIILLLVVAYLVFKPVSNSRDADSATATYTSAQVSEHSTKSDCWTIIDGGVYNITAYVDLHPGGDEILRACGTDGTALFKDRKTASGEETGSGSPHSASAESRLKTFYAGDLVE